MKPSSFLRFAAWPWRARGWQQLALPRRAAALARAAFASLPLARLFARLMLALRSLALPQRLALLAQLPLTLAPRLLLAQLALAPLLLLGGCFEPGGTPLAKAQAAANTPDAPRDVAVARGKVEVQGGLLEVLPLQDGVVESLAVQEGDAVKRGQPLLRLVAEQARSELALAQAELKLVQARQRAQAARLPAARQLAQRTGEAARAGALDPQRAEEAQQAERDIEAAVAVLEAEADVARRKLAQAQLGVQRQTLTAALDARVLRLAVQPGARVAAQGGRPLMVLLPERPLIVRAELNESYLASVKPGMRASISSEATLPNGARPAALPARVLRLSPAFGASRLDEDAAARVGLRVVDCFLELEPAAAAALRLGQDVRVNFHE